MLLSAIYSQISACIGGIQVRTLVAAVALLFTLVSAQVAVAAPANHRSASLALDPTHNVVVSSPKGAVVLRAKSSGPARLGVTERYYYFSVGRSKSPIAHVWLTVRKLQTGAAIVFARMSSDRTTVPVTLLLTSPAKSYSKHDLHLQPNLAYDKHLGVDRTSGPYGWVTLSTGAQLDRSVFISKAYRYKKLTKKYRKGKTSTIKALVSEQTLLSVGREKKNRTAQIAMSLSARRDSCERYFVVSPYSLTDAKTTPALITEVTHLNVRWLDPAGANRKSSYSTEPTTKIGYAHSLLLLRTDDIRRAYERTDSPFFRDLLLNEVYTLSLTRSTDGLWRTDYTSTWVKDESGITAPYIDTRHNEGIALAAPKIVNAFNTHGITYVNSIRGWASPFATFLARRAAAGGVIRTAHGYYFADYYDASGTAKCHASLNHTLGEMNYLLNQCDGNTASPLFAIAMKMKAAVDDCGTRYIAPNKDLYYERTMNGRYKGTDYPTVTYMDLLNSQQLFTRLLGAPDPIFDKLIASKTEFLGVSVLSRLPAVSALVPSPPAVALSPGSKPPEDMSEQQ
jgi:hypothetical protein